MMICALLLGAALLDLLALLSYGTLFVWVLRRMEDE